MEKKESYLQRVEKALKENLRKRKVFQKKVKENKKNDRFVR